MKEIIPSESYIGRRFFIHKDGSINQVEITNFLAVRESRKRGSVLNAIVKVFMICVVATENGTEETKLDEDSKLYLTEDDAIEENSEFYRLKPYSYESILSARLFTNTYKGNSSIIEVYYLNYNNSVYTGYINSYAIYLVSKDKEDILIASTSVDFSEEKDWIKSKWYFKKELAFLERNKKKKIFRLP